MYGYQLKPVSAFCEATGIEQNPAAKENQSRR